MANISCSLHLWSLSLPPFLSLLSHSLSRVAYVTFIPHDGSCVLGEARQSALTKPIWRRQDVRRWCPFREESLVASPLPIPFPLSLSLSLTLSLIHEVKSPVIGIPGANFLDLSPPARPQSRKSTPETTEKFRRIFIAGRTNDHDSRYVYTGVRIARLTIRDW